MNELAQSTQTILRNTVSQYAGRVGLKFAPDEAFYQKVGINPKRFGQLLRGEKRPTIDEARALSVFFSVSIDELF